MTAGNSIYCLALEFTSLTMPPQPAYPQPRVIEPDGLQPILGVVGARVDAGPGRALDRKVAMRIRQPGSGLERLADSAGSAAGSCCGGASHPLAPADERCSEGTFASRGAKCRLVTWDEPPYPQLLREMYDSPLLYVKGNAELLNRHAISIVGTRRPTPYGNQMAGRLSRDLAARGLVIVSGPARGIDATAHKGALDSAQGATVGVSGCGIDVIYPKENQKIFAEIEQRGAIITEFPRGTFPAPQNFPIRNRIIAGMARGVAVVEGAQYSGSLITARLAMEYGREVFAVPGGEEVIEELPTPIRAELVPVETTDGSQRASLVEENPGPAEKTPYALLAVDASKHVDELVEQSKMNSSAVLSALFELEMKGLGQQLPGKQFLKGML
jgi:DNA processing protein